MRFRKRVRLQVLLYLIDGSRENGQAATQINVHLLLHPNERIELVVDVIQGARLGREVRFKSSDTRFE